MVQYFFVGIKGDIVYDEHREQGEKTVKIRRMIMFVVQKTYSVFLKNVWDAEC